MGKGGRVWLCAPSTQGEIYCTVKLCDHSLLLSQLIKYDERETTSALRTSSYFLSSKCCSENKTAREQGFVSSLCRKLSLLSSQQLLLEYIKLHQILWFQKVKATHIATAKPRRRAPADYFYLNFLSSSKREIAPLFQKICPEPGWIGRACTLMGALPLQNLDCSLQRFFAVALAVPPSLTWETKASRVGANTKP